MSKTRRMALSVRISLAAVFTALTSAATMAFSLYVPATKGFFNIGETMVYTSALLLGPLVGAFAGGIGSMLADLLLGYSFYAPATLFIKAFEGAIVGYLSRRSPTFGSRAGWRVFTSSVGLTFGAFVGYIGMTYYSGYAEASVGLPFIQTVTWGLSIPYQFWLLVASLVVISMASVGFIYEPKMGWLVVSVIVGGLEMVLGYFIYEWVWFGPAALAEVPVNLGQLTVGLLVSIPLVRAIRSRLPIFREESL